MFLLFIVFFFFFFFKEEDGIRDTSVTGVQTCALPICSRRGPTGSPRWSGRTPRRAGRPTPGTAATARPWTRRGPTPEIGRASCKEKREITADDVRINKKQESE